MRRRGFSLLEVMVAVAILGLTLSVILSAQGGLAASNRSAANMGTAANLARCKMTETEEKLLKFGYSETDQIDTGVSCCEDADREGFICDTRVEKIELPNPPSSSLTDGGTMVGDPAASGSPLAAMLNNPAGGGGLDLDASALMQGGPGGLQGLGNQLTQQIGGGQGTQGLLSMVMGIVYPALKPMMEASIRRLTITVKWKEGPNQRELPLIEYVTNPQRGGFIAGMPDGGVPPGAGSASSPFGPTPTSTSMPTTPTMPGLSR